MAIPSAAADAGAEVRNKCAEGRVLIVPSQQLAGWLSTCGSEELKSA